MFHLQLLHYCFIINNNMDMIFSIVEIVGIEELVNEVIDMLEWGSEQNSLIVILHGFGGMGKTTLTHVIFSMVKV